jgi:hypothetical protein
VHASYSQLDLDWVDDTCRTRITLIIVWSSKETPLKRSYSDCYMFALRPLGTFPQTARGRRASARLIGGSKSAGATRVQGKTATRTLTTVAITNEMTSRQLKSSAIAKHRRVDRSLSSAVAVMIAEHINHPTGRNHDDQITSADAAIRPRCRIRKPTCSLQLSRSLRENRDYEFEIELIVCTRRPRLFRRMIGIQCIAASPLTSQLPLAASTISMAPAKTFSSARYSS